MILPTSSVWRHFPCSSLGKIPPLLISTAFDHSRGSYTIKLTDLSHVWTESLDRKSLIRRGIQEDTSIDLLDGSEQIKTLLDLIQAALDGNHEKGQSRLTLNAKGMDRLRLEITVTLPQELNLRPLVWPMTLTKCPDSTIASQLVFPMLQAHETHVREAGLLQAIIKEKDGVISKLIDKLEATGIPLVQVFTSLAGRKSMSKSMAEKFVRGLAPFKQSEFAESIHNMRNEARSLDTFALLANIYGARRQTNDQSDMDACDVPDMEPWWLGLENDIDITFSRRDDEVRQMPSYLPPRLIETKPIDAEDGFQTQSTPEHPKSGQGFSSTAMRGREGPGSPSTTNDEAADSNPCVSSPPQKPERLSRPRAPLGMIGGRKTHPHLPSSTSNAKSKTLRAETKLDGGDSDTASDTDETTHKLASPSSPSRSTTLPQKHGVLGQIRGRAKGSNLTTHSEQDSSSQRTGNPPESTRKAESTGCRLGQIGKPFQRATMRQQPRNRDDEGNRGHARPSCKPGERQASEDSREASEERANCKRRELQDQLSKKATTEQAKKKRKF